MSTALVEEPRTTEEVEERELVLDTTTRQRMAVAACAAETLEEFADSGAWDRLDPAIAEHLAGHARRLCGFLGRVRHLRAVRDCEREMLAVRRTERRLEVCLDLLVEEEETTGEREAVRRPRKKSRGQDEAFLGDFTNKTLTDEQRKQVRERRRKRKEAKKLFTPRAKRILLYVVGCIGLTISSLVLVAMSDLQRSGGGRQAAPPVQEPMELNTHLEDLQVFLPAKMVVQQQGTAIVMVRREWLLKSQDQRQVDADGAHVFLQNRAIPRLELFWEDGGLIGRAEKDGHFVFREDLSRPDGRPSAEEASAEGGDRPAPALGPPGAPGAPGAP